MVTQPQQVDLVVLVDGSGGMWDSGHGELTFLDTNLPVYIQQARGKCAVDFQVQYFIVQDVNFDIPSHYPGLKNFKQPLTHYLESIGVPASSLHEPFGSVVEIGGSGQDEGQASNLALAVCDASQFYNWRPNAAREILLIGDEGWYIGEYRESMGGAQTVQRAIDSARAQHVTVYTWRTIPGAETYDPQITLTEYKKVADSTGGICVVTPQKVADQSAIFMIEHMVCAKAATPAGVTNPSPVTLRSPITNTPPITNVLAVGNLPSVASAPAISNMPPATSVPAVSNVPPATNSPSNTNSPLGDPGGSGESGALCDQLPTVLKTICSIATLLNKVVDACYPPSLWPSSPYPDGCGNVGSRSKAGDCGCGGNAGTPTGSGSGPRKPAGSPASSPHL